MCIACHAYRARNLTICFANNAFVVSDYLLVLGVVAPSVINAHLVESVTEPVLSNLLAASFYLDRESSSANIFSLFDLVIVMVHPSDIPLVVSGI